MNPDFATWADRASRAHRTLRALIWSVQCAGCNRWDELLCAHCARLGTKIPTDLVLDDAEGIPSWPMLANGKYEGALRNILLAAKHDPVMDLSEFLFQAGYTLGTNLGKRVHIERGEKIWVVPVPSSRKRQRDHAEIVPFIAEGVQIGLRNALALRTDTAGLRTDAPTGAVPQVSVVYAVRPRSLFALASTEKTTTASLLERFVPAPITAIRSSSQRGRGVRARGLARAGTMELALKLPKNVRVVVVDDVCASGATLREVLRHVGDQTLAIAVVAASGPS
ncbi:MAG: phosphoribosyltransferase family protein [Scrofimicrobium sp.]